MLSAGTHAHLRVSKCAMPCEMTQLLEFALTSSPNPLQTVFVKLFGNSNSQTKQLFGDLKIRSTPSFIIFKDGKVSRRGRPCPCPCSMGVCWRSAPAPRKAHSLPTSLLALFRLLTRTWVQPTPAAHNPNTTASQPCSLCTRKPGSTRRSWSRACERPQRGAPTCPKSCATPPKWQRPEGCVLLLLTPCIGP